MKNLMIFVTIFIALCVIIMGAMLRLVNATRVCRTVLMKKGKMLLLKFQSAD